MKKLLTILAAALLAILPASAKKTGFINTDSVLVSMPEYVRAQGLIKDMSSKWQSELESDLKAIEELYNKYQQQKQYLTPSTCATREQQIIDLESALKAKQDKYFGNGGEMASYSAKLLGPIREKVDRAVSSYAAAGGYGCIIDLAVTPGIVYHDPADDITGAIIETLK